MSEITHKEIDELNEIVGNLNTTISSFCNNVPLTTNTSTEGFNAISTAGFDTSSFSEYDSSIENIINSLQSLVNGINSHIESSVLIDEQVESEMPSEVIDEDEQSDYTDEDDIVVEEDAISSSSMDVNEEFKDEQTEKAELDDQNSEEKDELNNINENEKEKQELTEENTKKQNELENIDENKEAQDTVSIQNDTIITNNNINNISNQEAEKANIDKLIEYELDKVSLEDLKELSLYIFEFIKQNDFSFNELINNHIDIFREVLLSSKLGDNIKLYVNEVDDEKLKKVGISLYERFENNNLL